MADKVPIRAVFNDSSVATGLAEFQTGDTVPLAHGGLGAALSIGSAGQVIKVNSGGSALEFGAVEAIVNIDNATNLTSATLATGDQILISDGGTEGRATLSQLDTLFKDTSQTLTNKTISGSANTLSNIGNSSLTNSSVNFGGVTLSLGASDATPAFNLTDATNYPTSSLSGTITNAQLAGSIANSKLSNSSLTLVDDSSTATTLSLGETLKVTGSGGVTSSVSGDTLTIAVDGSIVTESSTDTLTNKTISGGSNTLTNIANSSLTNSSVNFGGVTLALGASDATPAFDLTDATNYPTSSLSGTITNAQLAGSISNDKLAGSISNDKLAGSIANSKLANSSITVVDDSSTSTTLSLGETLKVQGTANEVNTSLSGDTITIGLPNNVTISGNLTVSGSTTTVSSTTINVADPLLNLATTNNSADAVDIGFYGLYDTSGSQDLYAGLFRDASDSGKFRLFKDLQAAPTTTVNTSGTGYAVATLVANLEGAVTGNASTATTLATARNIAGQSFDGSAAITIASTDLSDTSSIILTTNTKTLTNKSIDSDNNTITNLVNADIKSSAAIEFSKMENLTASRALVSDSNGDVSASVVTSTEIGHLDGVSDNIQTQLDTKAATSFAIAQAIALG